MGGGGGGNRSFGGRDTVRELMKEAKKELEKAKESRRAVFISFASEDINEVNLLRGQAMNDNSDLDFIDRSLQEPIDSERSAYIKQKITEKIRQASVTVVYLSDHAAASDWVVWEIEKSLELGKKVIAVHKGLTPPGGAAAFCSDKGIKVVAWSNLAGEL